MKLELHDTEKRDGTSKMKLALGAFGLFLFIVGLKRTFHLEQAPGYPAPMPDPGDPAPAEDTAPSRP